MIAFWLQIAAASTVSHIKLQKNQNKVMPPLEYQNHLEDPLQDPLVVGFSVLLKSYASYAAVISFELKVPLWIENIKLEVLEYFNNHDTKSLWNSMIRKKMPYRVI